MNHDRWAHIDALLEQALTWPAAERRARLAASAGDPALEAEVLALLEAHERADERIGESALDLVPIDDEPAAPSALRPGDRVGPWRIVEQIGQGGMGSVYLAERDDAEFERAVAIKVIRPGVDAGLWARRFRAERRILARLEHPNIARLYDSGVTTDGRPCLVMEYVPGARIDRHADAQGLELRDRLRLFLQACEGVSHAHQQLVVHRDLKPDNVRVTPTGSVKLLDFGIAKLLDPADEEEPVTRTGFRPLTPEYAPPEQVRGEPVSARVDVYGLGVILHELLTGARPAWQRHVLARANADAVEAAMVPPSRAPGLAEARRRALRGDLDTIVLTALAPDPVRRYPSVEALRDDVTRYLGGRPIAARRASRADRAAKFVRRNPLLVGAGVLLLLLVAGYVATVAVQSRRVARERDRAELERQRADEVVRVLTSLFAAADPFATGRPDTLRLGAFAAQAAERVEREFARQPAVRARLLGVLGTVQRQLGDLAAAAPLLERAVALHRETGSGPADLAGALADLGVLRRQLRELPVAEQLLREALALDAGAAATSPARRALLQGHLATVLVEQGRTDAAIPLLDSAIAATRRSVPVDSAQLAELLGNRGAAAQRLGDRTTALDFMREAHAVQRAHLGPDHPATLTSLGNVGFLTDRTGGSATAVPLLEEASGGLARRLGDTHPAVLATRRNLAGALSRAGRLDSAVTLMTAITATEQRVRGRSFELGINYDYLAGMYDQAGRLAEAERAFRENHAIFRERVGPAHVNTALALARWAWARCRPGMAADAAAMRAALADFDRALAVVDSVLPDAHNQRVDRHVMRAACRSRAGRTAEAEAEFLAQLAVARPALAPGAPSLRFLGAQLVAHHERAGDAARLAWARATAESLSASPPR